MTNGPSSDNREKGQGQGADANLNLSESNQTAMVIREYWLEKVGFTKDNIAEIRQNVSDLSVHIMDDVAGLIDHVAEQAASLATQKNLPVVFKFNESIMIVLPGDKPDAVVDDYLRKQKAQQSSQSPETVAKRQADIAHTEEIFAQLPVALQQWVSHRDKPGYGRNLNVLIAKDAYLLATTLKHPDAIAAWSRLTPSEQVSLVPGISPTHSGQSLQEATRVAISYAREQMR